MGLLGVLGCGLGAGTSHAAAFHVEARTEAQAYQIRAWRGSTPESPVLLPRRRIVQYLGLNAFELVTGEDMGFESNLRIWADFGLPRGEAALVDGQRSEDAELLHAYVRYAAGGFEGRLGRQIYRGDQPCTVEVRVAEGQVLAPATLHTLVLRDSLTDLEGNPLLAELRVEFTTQP